MGASSTKVEKTAFENKPEELSKYEGKTQWWTEKPDSCMDINYAETGAASEAECPARTLPELFQMAVKKRGDKLALTREPLAKIQIKDGKAPPALPQSQWDKWTFKEYYEESRVISKGFIKLGMQAHDAVSILGFNSPEWFMSQMGCILGGGMAAGVYPSDTETQIQFKAKHSNSAVVCVEDEAGFTKYKNILDEIPYVKAIITWGFDSGKEKLSRSDGTEVKVFTWDGLKKFAQDESDDTLDARIAAQKPGMCCNLIYTSGTTGTPKAVMISHDNLQFEAYLVLAYGMPHVGAKEEAERVLSFLPLSHVAGMMVDIASTVMMTALKPGWCEVHFARPYDLKAGTLGDRLGVVRPTIFLGVPRVWEKISERLKAVGATVTGPKKKLSTWAKAKGLEYGKNTVLGGSGSKPSMYGVATKVHDKVKVKLGLETCKFGFTGAAPITVATLEYFSQLGININEVYGMSECTGATTWSTDSCHVWGSVGYALNGQEVKILKPGQSGDVPRAPAGLINITEEHQGEICFRGRHIMMGYMANPVLGEEHVEEIKKKNAEAIDENGWLHSGDKGCCSERGMFKICGRYKELIISAGGENIAPVPIEDNIKLNEDGISNIVMIGDKRKFNVALVTLKAVGATGELPGGDELDGAALKLADGVTTISAAMDSEAVIKKITDAITKTNNNPAACPSNACKIQKFTILPLDLSVQTEDLTATLKLKRSVVENKYKDIVEKMMVSSGVYTKFE